MPLSLFHLHGNLEDLPFPRLLASLGEDRFTGVLQIVSPPGEPPADQAASEASEVTREIHFREGRLAWAISTSPEETLRAALARDAGVTAEQWATAEESARQGTLRQSLVDLGIVTPLKLEQVERARAEAIVLGLFDLASGEYRVRERQPSPSTPDLDLDPRPLLMRGMMERADRDAILREVGGLDSVFTASRSEDATSLADLPGEFRSILAHVDGRRSLAQISVETGLPDQIVSGAMAGLCLAGAVRRAGQEPRRRPRPEATPNRPEAGPVQGRLVEALEAAAPPAPLVPSPRREARPVEAAPVPRPVPAAHEAAEGAESTRGSSAATARTGAAIRGGSPPTASIGDETVRRETPLPVVRTPEAARPPGAALPRPAPLEAAREAGVGSRPDSIYSRTGLDEGSRPWFLVGGAVAVGLVTLFLVLMSHEESGGTELAAPAAPLAGLVYAEGAGSDNETDVAGGDPADPDGADGAGGGVATAVVEPTSEAYQPAPAAASTPVAGASRAPIFKERTDRAPRASGIDQLHAGDLRGAAAQFQRSVSSREDNFTIQLLTACREETVQRAVERAGGSSELFILATSLDGRRCYRVLWGAYRTRAGAQEALRRDVPASLRGDRPRIARLGSL